MVTTVQQVLHPIFITCFIIGLDFYPIHRKKSRIRWTVNLSILYSLTMWLAYTYFFYYMTTLIIRVLGTFLFVIAEINVFTAIMSVILSHYHRKKFAICLKKLANVDDTLEKLGASKIYQKMHIWSKRIVIGWFISSLILDFYGCLWWLNNVTLEEEYLYMPHVINHPVHTNTLVDLLFISILWHLHLELCRLARELNLIFGIQMTFEMASCFFYLTGLCHHLCHMIMKEHRNRIFSIFDLFNMGIWVLLFLVKLFAINYICESVSIKANKIDKIIHKLTSTLRYADVWKDICQFTLQIMCHQLKFTGMGLFYFGNSLLRKLCATIVTFVIIMRQMNIQ